MPIEVRHDPPAAMTALAGLMAGRGAGAAGELESRRQAGRLAVQLDAQQTRQTQQLDAQRDAQMRQIEAQADRQKEAADTAYARTALAAGLQEKIQERQFDNQMAGMQQAAKLKASQFEYQFTAQQRQRIARNNEARQRIRSSDFSDVEKTTMLRAIDMDDFGIEPGLVPADPNKQTFPEGRSPGEEFQDKSGNSYMVGADGTPKMTLRWDQTKEANEKSHVQEMELKQLEQAQDARDRDDKRRATIEATRARIATTQTTFTDKDGNEVKRFPDAAEVFHTLLKAHPAETWPRGEGPGAEAQQQQAPQPPQVELEPLLMDTKVSEEDSDLPPVVGRAQAYVRKMKNKINKGEGLFPDELKAFRQANEILSMAEREGI